MEDDLLRYYEEEDTLAAIRSMLGRLKQGGILVFHIMDLEPLVYCGKEANSALTPLLLGEELNGTRNSLIRLLDFVAHWDSVIARYIYHLEDLSTGAVTVDWEQVRYIAAADDDPGDYIELAGGFFHEQIVVGDDLLLVGGTERPDTYAGPPSIHWKEEAADSGEA